MTARPDEHWGVWGTPTDANPLSVNDPCRRARWMDETRYTLITRRFVVDEATAREYAAMLNEWAGEHWTFVARKRESTRGYQHGDRICQHGRREGSEGR